jgi:hypothetical protein
MTNTKLQALECRTARGVIPVNGKCKLEEKMKKSFIVLAVLCLAQSTVLGNLLINGDAEGQGLIAWTLSGQDLIFTPASQKQHTGWIYPAQGDYFISFGRIQGSYAMMTQTGLIPDNAETLTLGGWFQGEYSDYGIASLTVYDHTDVELVSVNTANMTTPILTWQTFQIEVPLPQNSYSWEVTLEGFLDYGSVVNAFYDDVYLIPEPATLFLLAAGALAVRRRYQ